MAIRNYRIGNDLVVLWAICNRDGSPYDLAGKQIRLYVTNERGRKEVTPILTALPDGTVNNVIRWDFLGIEQRVTGLYTLSVEIFSAYGKKNITKDCCDAFYLVSSSSLEDEVLEENISDGGELMLSSSLDVIHVTAPKVEIGENGNWFIDGIDTNVSAYGKSGATEEFVEEKVNEINNTIISNEEITATALTELDTRLTSFENKDISDKETINASLSSLQSVVNTKANASDVTSLQTGLQSKADKSEVTALQTEIQAKAEKEEVDALRQEVIDNEEITAAAFSDMRNFVEESIGNSVEQEVSGEKVYAIADGILSNTNDVYYHLPYINEEDVDHTLATKGDIQSAIASAITTTLNTEV